MIDVCAAAAMSPAAGTSPGADPRGVGSGSARQDLQLELLSEVVARINEMFGSEFADPQIEGFIVPAAGMAEEDPRIVEQIDHSALDQFMTSPGLREPHRRRRTH